MFNMPTKGKYCALLLCSALTSFILGADLSFAQENVPVTRDNLIFASLNQVESRQKAVADAMMEAQMIEVKNKPAKQPQAKQQSETGFSNLASKIHPYFLLNTAYDNNLYNARYDVDSSLINTITPGLKINFQGRNTVINLDAYFNNKYYSQYYESNMQNGGASLLANFLINRFTLAFSDTYRNYYGKAEVPALDDSSYDNTIQWSNNFSTTLSRQFNRYGLNLIYSRSDHQYRPGYSFSNNYYQDVGTINQTFAVSKKTQFLFGYEYNKKTYSHTLPVSGDFYYNQYKLTLTKILTAKMTALISGTYKTVDYKEDDDYKEGIYGISFSYQPSMRTNLALKYEHTPHDAPNPDTYTITNDVELSMIYRPAFSSKLQFTASAEAQLVGYPKLYTGHEYSNTFEFNAAINYFFRPWLDFSLSYKNRKDQGSKATKYVENYTVFKAQARF